MLWRDLHYSDSYSVAMPDGFGVTRIEIPKNREQNLEFRERLIARCDEDDSLRATVVGFCQQLTVESLLFWINTFAWTYVQIQHTGPRIKAVTGAQADQPFITWVCQDDALTTLFRCIMAEGDAGIKKSRDMGATWMILGLFEKLWQFHENMNFMVLSRKEDLVDKPGDPDSLFWKLRYMLSRQPPWLVPAYTSAAMTLVNTDRNSTIIGSATTEEVGHGGRKTAALLDEMGRMRKAQGIWEGLASTTGCRIGNSTPHGPNFFHKVVTSPHVKQIVVPWWDHPDKGVGRYLWEDPKTGRKKIRSPWYDAQVERAVSKREIAENLDMDFMGSGYVFFDTDQIDRHRSRARENLPIYQGELELEADGVLDMALQDLDSIGRWRDDDRGHWRLWCELEADREGVYRPNQNYTYVMGVDIAHGLGASNSVICVGCVETSEIIAEFASAEIEPSDLARLAVAAGVWWGGSRGLAFIEHEANGPGQAFGKMIARKLRYPWYYKQRETGKTTEKPTKGVGWTSSEKTKPLMLGMFRSAMAKDEIIVYSEELLGEAEQYVYFETGAGVGPSSLEQESTAARATHGDRVIAGGLCHDAMTQCHRAEPPERVPPKFSAAWRRKNPKVFGRP